MNRDALNNMPAWASVTGAYAGLDGIQTFPPAQQVAGIALLFTAVADGLGLDISELVNQSRRRFVEAQHLDNITQRTEAKSLAAYIQGELR